MYINIFSLIVVLIAVIAVLLAVSFLLCKADFSVFNESSMFFNTVLVGAMCSIFFLTGINCQDGFWSSSFPCHDTVTLLFGMMLFLLIYDAAGFMTLLIRFLLRHLERFVCFKRGKR